MTVEREQLMQAEMRRYVTLLSQQADVMVVVLFGSMASGQAHLK